MSETATEATPAAADDPLDAPTRQQSVLPEPEPTPTESGQAANAESAVVSEPTAAPENTGSVARNSSIMAIGSLASRATGFIRTAVIGATLSGAVMADSYQVANVLPGQIYELLLGGVLASVVVPLLVKARKTDPDGGDAYTARLLTVATMLLAAATMVALLAVPLLTTAITSESSTADQRQVVTWLSYLLMPMIFFYGIAALLAAVLNTRGHFAAPMWAPIVNNAVVISTCVLFMTLPGPALPTPATITPTQLLVLGIGTTLGVIAQTAALLPALRKVNFRWRWRFDFAEARLGEAGKLAGWMLVYVAVSQVAVFVVTALAYRAGERGESGTFIFNNAYLLFMMVHGIVAVSVITALLPRMSAAAVDGKFDTVGQNLSLGIRLSSVVLVPATAFYLVLGLPLAITAFQWGNFTLDQSRATGYAVMAAGLGLVPFAVSQLQTFAFYAMRDTKTPALINIPVNLIRVGLYFAVYFTLPAEAVVAGFMVANAASYTVAVIISAWALRRRIGRMGLGRIVQTITRLALAAAIAGLIAWAISYGITTAFGGAKLGAGLALLIAGAALLAGYTAAAVFVRVREVGDLATMVGRRVPGLNRLAALSRR